jgi:hypothetical protein
VSETKIEEDEEKLFGDCFGKTVAIPFFQYKAEFALLPAIYTVGPEVVPLVSLFLQAEDSMISNRIAKQSIRRDLIPSILTN